MRSRSRILSVLVFGVLIAASSLSERPARGDEPGPALLVVALPEGTCAIDGTIEGPSPLLAKPPAGTHEIVCRREVSGVVVKRGARAVTSAGKPAKVVVDLRGGP